MFDIIMIALETTWSDLIDMVVFAMPATDNVNVRETNLCELGVDPGDRKTCLMFARRINIFKDLDF